MKIKTKFWSENLKLKYILEDLKVDGRIIIYYENKFKSSRIYGCRPDSPDSEGPTQGFCVPLNRQCISA
jgi:hypothetical protein